jgi:aerobic-type carbon monoxide dehydrogenase small subunit (CoxS/CutS family)
MAISLKINGKSETVDAAPGTPLLWVLRDHLGMTGTKFGCGIAQCGACTVHVDGQPTRACITPHDSLEDAEITTIEGVEGNAADAIRKAWVANDVPQCGYCQSGPGSVPDRQLLSRHPLKRTLERAGQLGEVDLEPQPRLLCDVDLVAHASELWG